MSKSGLGSGVRENTKPTVLVWLNNKQTRTPGYPTRYLFSRGSNLYGMETTHVDVNKGKLNACRSSVDSNSISAVV
jgi:hypothetical protein